MKSLVYQQLSTLTSAIGIGLPFGTPSAYAAATTYSVGQYVTSPSKDGVVSLTAPWYCIKAGKGKTPAANPDYWLELDSNGIPVHAVYAAIQCEGADLRWTDDGLTTPTGSVGNILPYNAATYPNSELMYNRGYLGNVQIIQQTTTAKANVTFYAN